MDHLKIASEVAAGIIHDLDLCVESSPEELIACRLYRALEDACTKTITVERERIKATILLHQIFHSYESTVESTCKSIIEEIDNPTPRAPEIPCDDDKTL